MTEAQSIAENINSLINNLGTINPTTSQIPKLLEKVSMINEELRTVCILSNSQAESVEERLKSIDEEIEKIDDVFDRIDSLCEHVKTQKKQLSNLERVLTLLERS